ncbi:ATP-binding protein [Oryzobacter telluris]|uniref:ATP-binding protein n=1 Tax=Oryzobacter telluris TaxID=3149179 RepID=UPI00370D47E8
MGEGESEWALIGRLAESGPMRNVHLGLDREHVLAIVGKRGSGKSFTLGVLLEGLCASRRESSISASTKERATLLFDTLNIFQWMTAPVTADSPSAHVAQQRVDLSRWNLEAEELDVDLWVPAGFEDQVTGRALPFRIRTWEMQASDWAALLKVDATQDVMGQLITATVERVRSKGWTRADGSAVAPQAEYTIGALLDCLSEDSMISTDFAPSTIRAVRQRLSAYDASPLFGSDGTSLAELLRPGRLSVLLLSGVPDDVRAVVVYLTLRKLMQARARASEASKSLELGFATDRDERIRCETILAEAPPKTWVVIDEAQNVFPAERATAASETLLKFVREGRNFGLSLAFTTQQPTALDARVMAQVDTFIVHTLTVDRDIKSVTQNLKSREPNRLALSGRPITLSEGVRDLAIGQAMLSSTDATRSMFLDIRPRVSVHGGYES